MNRATPLVLAALLTLSGLAVLPAAHAAPTIATVSPTSGSTNGGTLLNITGGGFTAGAIVQLVQGSTVTTLTNIQVTATSIRGTTPPTPTQSPGTFQVRVTNPDGSSTLSGSSFTYAAAPAPTVSSVSPTSGPSTGGTTLVITGTGFSNTVRPSVTVAGVPAVVQSSSGTTIVAVTSALPGTSASGNVVVRNPDGSAPATSSQPFTYAQAPSPVLSNIVPTAGDANGGATFTLTGINFAPGATVRFIPPDGTTGPLATSVGFISASQLTGKTPPMAAKTGAYSVQIINPDGQTHGLATVYTVSAGPSAGNNLKPFRVTSVEPRSGPSSGGTPVTIGGDGFAAGPGLEVMFGTNPATEVKFVSTTQLTAVTPRCGVAGVGACNGTITVKNPAPGGLPSAPIPADNAFTYMAQVVITGTSVATVPTTGAAVTITGSGFLPPCQVYIGGIRAKVTQECATSAPGVTTVTVRAPAGTTGSKDIQVINRDGRTATLQGAIGYTLPSPPQFHATTPLSSTDSRVYVRDDSVNGGLEIDSNGGGILRLHGTGFIAVNVTDPFTGNYRYTSPTVTVNGIPAVVVNGTEDGTRLDIIVPPVPASSFPDLQSAQCKTTGPPDDDSGSGVGGGVTLPGSNLKSCIPGDIKVVNLDGQSATLASVTDDDSFPSDTVRFSYAKADGPDGDVDECGSQSLCAEPLTTGGMFINDFDGFSGVAPGRSPPRMGQTFFGPVVKLAATPVQSLVVNGPSSMDFVAPPRTTAGAVDLTLLNPDGQAATIAGDFRYVKAAAPTFNANSLSATSGSALGSSGPTGNDLVISSTAPGSNGFTAGMTVFFDQTPVVLNYPQPCNAPPPAPVILTNCFAGASQGEGGNTIRVRVPGHPEGPVTIRIVALDGQAATLANAYTYLPENSPIVSDISPKTAPGVGGNRINITGTGFAQGSTTDGVTDLKVANYLKPQVRVDNILVDPRNVTFLNANQIQVVLPNHAAGTVTITVTNPDRKDFSVSDVFRYLGTQTGVSLLPNSGPQNGGVAVKISGAGFDTSRKTQAPAVLFGTTLASAKLGTGTAVGSTNFALTFTPDGPSGPVTLFLVDQDGQTLTFPRGYTYTAAVPPSFTSLSPVAGSTNGGTLVTLKGSGFAPGSRVCMATMVTSTVSALPCTTPLTTTQFVDTQTLKFTTPSSPPGPVDIAVVNPSGDVLRILGTHNLFGYSQAPSPIVTSVAPTSGDVKGGTPVTLSGANFQAGAQILFDNTPATNVSFVSATTMTAKTPAHSRGAVSVTMTVPGGLSYTLTPGFTYTGNSTSSTNSTTTTQTDQQTTTGTTTTPGGTSTTSTTTTPGGNDSTVTAEEIIAANQEVEVTVTRDGDDNIVSFTLPLNLPATAQGVQVFRSNSPFILVATLDRTSIDFQTRSYLDVGAPLDSKYLVTIFYANGQGKAASSPDEIPGFDSLGDGVSSQEADNAKLTLVGYILVGVLAVFLAVLLVVLVLRGRRRPPAQQAVAATAPGGAPPAPGGDAEMRHSVNCPNCGSIFEAFGPKPLRMECPTCGKVGILR